MNRLVMTGTMLVLGCRTLLADNPLLVELTQRGLEMATATRVKLPLPAMPDGQDIARQSAVLDRLANRYPREEFMRRSVVAPFVLKMNSLPGPTQPRAAQTISLWFVAYGQLATVRSEQLLQALGKAAQNQGADDELAPRTETLAESELEQRQANSRPIGGQRQWYVACRIPILDRVLVDCVAHLIQTDTEESSLLAAQFDPRFNSDKSRPNQWRSILTDDFGNQRLGPAHEYAGFGGYVKATKLIEPPDAILIEAHAVFSEPEGWFGGTNQLRSKLPIVVRAIVHNFRRKLTTAEK